MKKYFVVVLCITSMLVSLLTGCAIGGNQKDTLLDPEHPVSLQIWHYYTGMQQTSLDKLIEEFNAGEGKEKGIYVEGVSQGSVDNLEQMISDAINEEVGAEKLPDIFSSYADSAYYAQKNGKLTDLTQYFTEAELETYVGSYIEEGKLEQNERIYLFPVAKSTEVMMINKTDWQTFATATGVALEDLYTVEGVVKVAEQYYQWTDQQTPAVAGDGKAFYGRDSMANYFVIGMKQQGTDIFDVQEGEISFHLDKAKIRRLWENYYVPFVKGYFAAYGKFRSDDVKTGDIIAYTGSTTSAAYFPDKVDCEDKNYRIECIMQEAPVLEGGQKYQVQQGAGMAVTKSDKKHEYASCLFLKWFTKKEQNLRFACEAAYMPVKKEANQIESLHQITQKYGMDVNEKTLGCLKNAIKNFDENIYYTTPCFAKGYGIRQILEYHLFDKAKADKEAIQKAGAHREQRLQRYTSEEAFQQWYTQFSKALQEAS